MLRLPGRDTGPLIDTESVPVPVFRVRLVMLAWPAVPLALLMAMVDARQISAEELARVAERLTAAEREAAERDAAGRSGGK